MSRPRSALAVLAAALVCPAHATAAAPDGWFGQDKLLHFGASLALAGAGYGGAALLTEDRGLRLGAGATLALGAGVAKELWDLSGRGDASFKDLAWDLVGTAVGLGVAFGLDHALSAARADVAPSPARKEGLAGLWLGAHPGGVLLRGRF